MHLIPGRQRVTLDALNLHYVMQYRIIKRRENGGAMSDTATINVRMPEKLKRGGGLVLERKRVSPTELVRSLYRFLDENQEIPPCLDIAQGAGRSKHEERRALLRSIPRSVSLPGDYDDEADRADRIARKYGDLL